MKSNGLLNDPAIVGMSLPEGGSNERETPAKLGLEPGNALSKLLDSAMANAAKEVTPEPETAVEESFDGRQQSRSDRSSFQDYLPSAKSDLSKIYSINQLLDLRSSPLVLEFDATTLPDNSFWLVKQKGPESHTSGKNHSQNLSHNQNSGGSGKRSRRQNQAANNATTDSLNWDRKPAGFLKHSDIDHMSKEKISQLLGEGPEEELPDWDLPGSNADLEISMGNTVEDFERWKSQMRQEERRKLGETDISDEVIDPVPSNDVDSFFSFAKPKDNPHDSASVSANKPTESKSSRFSSFFSGPTPGPSQGRGSSEISEHSTKGHETSRDNTIAGNSRFFQSGFEDKKPSPDQKFEKPQHPQGRLSHGPPPGMQANFQAFNSAQSSISASSSAPHPNQPPGFNLHSGPPQGPGMMMAPGRGGSATNDSFFFALLNKREDGSNSEADAPVSNNQAESTHSSESDQLGNPSDSRIRSNGNERFEGPRLSGLNAPNGPQAKLPQFSQYQNGNARVGPQHMNMDVPPGMKQFPSSQLPPGMFPPGMFPPGQQPPLNQRLAPNSQNRPMPIQPNTIRRDVENAPNHQARGEVPPPWMFGPNGFNGMAPPGFGQIPPGFPPGYPRPPPPANHQGQSSSQPH